MGIELLYEKPQTALTESHKSPHRLQKWTKALKESMHVLKLSGGRIVGTGAVVYTVLDLAGYSCAQVVGRSMQPTFNPSLPSSDYVRPKIHDSNNTIMPGFLFRTVQYMKNMFQPLDWVLISSRSRYHVKPGEIVTLHNAMKPYERDIKRIIATENHLVKSRTYKNSRVVVPKGYIWVEGDNHIMSSDSNRYGPIPASLVYGKAVAIIWPPSRWQRLGTDPPSTSNHINASEIPLHELPDHETSDDLDRK